MKFNIFFAVLIILSFAAFVFQFSLRDNIAYILYGYHPGIMGTGLFESYEAVRTTYFLRSILFYCAAGTNLLGLSMSVIAVFQKVFKKYYINYIVLALHLLIAVFYGIAYSVPRRAF